MNWMHGKTSGVLTAHGNTEGRVGRVLEVVEARERAVEVGVSIHEVGVLVVVEDVLDVGGLHCGGSRRENREKTGRKSITKVDETLEGRCV